MKEIHIINLTDRDIQLYPSEFTDISTRPVKLKDTALLLSRCIKIPCSGSARSEITRDTESIKAYIKGGNNKTVSLSYTHIGSLTGLGDVLPDTVYLVSQLAYNAFFHIRKDIFIIDKPIRSESGLVIACRGLSRPVYDLDNKSLNAIEKYLKKRFAELPSGIEATEVINCISLLTEYRKK